MVTTYGDVRVKSIEDLGLTYGLGIQAHKR